MKKIAVIGAGASGMAAALYAARNGARVTVFEKNSIPLKKLMRTGNGKCNFSNEQLDLRRYISEDPCFIKDRILDYTNKDLLFFFTQIGILAKSKNGYLYPYSEQALTVANAFLSEARSLYIDIKTDSFVNMIAYEDGRFLISVEGEKERFSFDRVIVSTGSKAGLIKSEKENGIKMLESLGLSFTDVYPGLTRLKLKGYDFSAIKGVRCEATASLKVNGESLMTEIGEVLFYEEGISGICIFNLSSLCTPYLKNGDDVKVCLDLVSDIDEEGLLEFIKTSSLLNAEKPVGEVLSGLINDRLAKFLTDITGIDPDEETGKTDFEKITEFAKLLKNLEFKVTDVDGFENSQVMAGGLKTSELKDNFESKKIPGLFVTGELIDVCGPCGGYNLQWAFTSGAIAGEKACY